MVEQPAPMADIYKPTITLAKHEAPSGTLEGDATVPSSQRRPSKQTSRQGREPPAALVQKSLVGRNRGSFSPDTPLAPANELALEPQRTLQPNHPAHKAPVWLPQRRRLTSSAPLFSPESGPKLPSRAALPPKTPARTGDSLSHQLAGPPSRPKHHSEF
ncbi:hypothetical protein CPLU01_08442 [Colletotrichum plurivorum]|uniref:Uncharacterized protein n=1 Tax=Colletotrichum plurivorum TaxID=2175906 RepID=A0A8H6ND74_9PEZI|nr:hypothetical protein CPLU01_08442 [Colletotrichum plurivorum]